MLEFKSDPKESMAALEQFLSIYYADRQLEYQRDLDEILSWNIPEPLKYLYPFIEKYLGKQGSFCRQDSLCINSGQNTYKGKILISSENQGCWSLYTETKGKDPPVWIEEYSQNDSLKWAITNNYLSEFLVTFCLREILLSSVYSYYFEKKTEEILSMLEKQGYETFLLWRGKYLQQEHYEMPQIDSFYLIEDSILVWDGGNSCRCGTNYKNASVALNLIKSECTKNLTDLKSYKLIDDDLRPF